MADVIVIEVPLPPNRANQSFGMARWEWAKKKRYIEGGIARGGRNIGAATLFKLYKPGLRKLGHTLPLQHVTVGSTFYLHQLMDEDNLKARLKWPLDALKTSGLIVDDDPQHCTVLDPVQLVDRKNKRLEIELRI